MFHTIEPAVRPWGVLVRALTRFRALAPRHRSEGYAALIASLAALGAYAFVALHGELSHTIQIEHIDLNVYRAGALAWLHGGNLYGALPHAAPGLELPFTYPPIAAVVLAPLAVLSSGLDGVLAIGLTVGLLALAMRLTLRTLGLPKGVSVNWAVLVAMPTALVLDPVRVTLVDGQIDVVLMALVMLDTLGGGLRIGPYRLRGVLVGLAAAIKLTPAVFVLFFLARGQRRAAATAAMSFAAFTGFGFLVARQDSAEYWGHVVFQTDRIGSVWYAANQSLEAMLARTGLTGHALHLTWLASCALVVLSAWVTMRRAARHSNTVGVLLLNALAELLISPISWTHHWVWIVPLLVASGVADRSNGLRGMRTVSTAAFALFALGPQWLLPHGNDRELRWALWEQAIGSSYTWFALAVIAMCAFTRPPRISDNSYSDSIALARDSNLTESQRGFPAS